MLSPPDADLARRDPQLPALPVLLDNQAFAAALAAATPHLGVVGATAHYVRYKPATNCLVAYRVETAAGETLDVYAKAYRPQDRGKFEKRNPLFLCDLPALVRLFPDDGEIPAMKLLADSEERAALLARLLPENSHAAALQRLAYKPERRYVAQIRGADGDPLGVLKLHSTAGFARMSRNAKVTQDWQVLRVARRLGRSSRYHALALEWMPGDLLMDRLAARDFDPASVSPVGRALAELHTYRARQKLAAPASREDEAASLRFIADAIAQIHPAAARRASALAQSLGEWLVSQPRAKRPIHGDFYSKQVVLQPDGAVAFLDLDEARRGDPAADVGNFIAHLERYALSGRIDARRAREVARELEKGYAGAGGAVTDDAVRTYTAACLFLLSPQPFRDRHPEWPNQIDRILGRVEDLCPAKPSSFSDPAMPFLRQALDPAVMQRELGHHLRAVRVVRHKPDRRCLIEYDVESNGRLMTLMGKVRAKALDESTFALNVALRQAGFADDAPDGIIIPEPIGTIPHLHMWLARKVPGVSAMQCLDDSTGRRLADVAMKLHRAGVPSRRKHTTADELLILHQRLQELAGRRPQWQGRLARLMDACRELAGNLPPERVGSGIHRDYYPAQVLIDGPRAYLLDLDLYCEGNPALDIGNCVAHVTEYALRTQGDPIALRACEEAVIERFARMNGADAETAARIFAVLSLARHIYISTTFPDRAMFTERILELCEERTRTPVPA